MFLFGLFSILLVTITAETCYKDVTEACAHNDNSFLKDVPALTNCSAKYGKFDKLETDLQGYVNGHIEISFKYLLMSTYFGNYQYNRNGFKGLYRKLSDDAWEKAIGLIKYITKRGGKMNFNQPPHLTKGVQSPFNFEGEEINSLSNALDLQKLLAEKALELHLMAKEWKDAAVAHYLEEEFMESQSETIRKLSGYIHDIKKMLNRDAALAVYLFDDYLQKSL